MIDSDEIDGLAAQYALGALAPGERRMVQLRMNREPALAEAVSVWERRLAPLSLREPGLTPPPHTLERILATLAQQSVSQQADRRGLAAAARPRRMTFAATALAATLAALTIALGAILIDRHIPPGGSLTAVLAMDAANATADEPAKTQGATFVVAFDRRSGLLTVRQTTGEPVRVDRAHVLWLVVEGDALRIGRLDRSGQAMLLVTEPALRRLQMGRLQMTLETEIAGEKPRGPLIAAGRFSVDR